jgi:hypothetical protein
LHKNKGGILAQVLHHRSHRPGHFWAGAGVVGVSLFSMVAALGTVNEARPTDIPQLLVVESLSLPALSARRKTASRASCAKNACSAATP